jgi:hypothetical protein
MVEILEAELVRFQPIHSLQVFLALLSQSRIGMVQRIVVLVYRLLDLMGIASRRWSVNVFCDFLP